MELIPVGGFNSSGLRAVFSCFPSGVVALCARVDDVPVGMSISSFTSVSLDPALVSVCIQKGSTTWPRLRESERFGLSILGCNQGEVCRQMSQQEGDRFANVSWWSSPEGAVFLSGAVACFECRTFDTVDAGDHLLVLLELSAHSLPAPGEPLVFHDRRFREFLP